MDSPLTFFTVIAGGVLVTALVMVVVIGYYFGMLELLEWLSEKFKVWRDGSSK